MTCHEKRNAIFDGDASHAKTRYARGQRRRAAVAEGSGAIPLIFRYAAYCRAKMLPIAHSGDARRAYVAQANRMSFKTETIALRAP